LLETLFGIYSVQELRKVEGRLLPFEAVHAQIADYLATAAWQRGVHQYLQLLVGRAEITGVSLEGADTPLVQ
ncbi:peptidylprolyl isomerase, partial [Halobellus sp. Atlit-31R]